MARKGIERSMIVIKRLKVLVWERGLFDSNCKHKARTLLLCLATQSHRLGFQDRGLFVAGRVRGSLWKARGGQNVQMKLHGL
jgi:hypothetical protein